MDERHNEAIQAMVDKNADLKHTLDYTDANKPNPKEVDLDGHKKLSLLLPGSEKVAKKYEQTTTEDSALGFKSIVAQMAFTDGGKRKADTEESGFKKTSSGIKPKKMSALEEIMIMNESVKKQQEERKKEIQEDGEKVINTGYKRKDSGEFAGSSLHTVSGEGLQLKKAGANTSKEVVEVAPEEIPWLRPNISVKITTKELGDAYYKQKGKVLEVVDEFTGIVQMFKTSAKVKLDQSHVETVIPAVGREVVILSGKYVGRRGNLSSLQPSSQTVSVDLYSTHDHNTKFLPAVKYEHLSKYIT